jgi:hypothetical protein
MADKRISQLVERVDIANNDVLPIVASGATTTNKVTISTIQDFMQGNLDLGVTSVGITLGTTGTDVNVSGSPITTSGNITINFPTASPSNRGLLSSADWITFYSKQPAGNYVTLDTTQTITAQKTFTTSGSSDTMIISHGSGSGFALDVIKAGSGEAIRVQKTSGSGNAMTISGGNFEAGTIVKTGGTSTQYLMADGSTSTLTNPVTGTGASGQVAFWNGTSSQTGDNGLFWDNVNKRLGVGTNVPSEQLEIRTGANTSFALTRNAISNTARMFFKTSGTFNWSFGTRSTRNDFSIFNETSTEALTINATSNNILINTIADAGFRLDVNGTARVQGALTTTADAVVNGVSVGLGPGSLSGNTRVGINALSANTTGNDNSFFGRGAGQNNTTGSRNSAFGREALFTLTTNNQNSAFGYFAGRVTTGGNNSFFGNESALNNTTGSSNSFFGLQSGVNNTTGSSNSFFGFQSGRFIADGTTALTIANNSVFLGSETRANADNQTNQIVIGHTAIGLGSNTTVIGNSSTTFGRWFGNLLVGTSTNAGYALDVVGTARTGTLRLLNLTDTLEFTNTLVRIRRVANRMAFDGFDGFEFVDSNASASRMRIFGTTGNVLIGSAADVASSILTVESTTKGFLPPRMTTTQKNAIASPATGLVVYDTTLNKLAVYTGAAWETITSV